MDIISLLQYTIGKVIETFAHNWYLLLISIIISAALKLYVDQDAIGRKLGTVDLDERQVIGRTDGVESYGTHLGCHWAASLKQRNGRRQPVLSDSDVETALARPQERWSTGI